MSAAAVLTATLALTACGGGGNDSGNSAEVTPAASDAGDATAMMTIAAAAAKNKVTDTSSTTSTSVVPVLAVPVYRVSTTELILNGQFGAGLQSWALADANSALVVSELRTNGQALRIASRATQSIAADKLEPGKSYTLHVKARNLQVGTNSIALRFREPVNREPYRTYGAKVSSTTYQDHQIDFTVPAYAAMAELEFASDGVALMVDTASLTMRTAIVQTEPVTSTVGSTVPAGYALAFNDEFNGTALNSGKWFTRYIYDSGRLDRLNDEQQRYRDNDNHRVANGVLSLVSRKVGSSDPWGINYESGMVRSDWTALYGYYEARVKMPGGKGVWPAFWLNSDVASDGSLGWPPEIDIFEYVVDGTYEKQNMLHTNVHLAAAGSTSTVGYADPAFNQEWRFWSAPYNFNDGWHTIAAEWTPDTVTTYIDGKKIVTRTHSWTRANGAMAGPAHILLNLAIGGSWAGRFGIDDSAFPQALQIDWVRAYKKVN